MVQTPISGLLGGENPLRILETFGVCIAITVIVIEPKIIAKIVMKDKDEGRVEYK